MNEDGGARSPVRGLIEKFGEKTIVEQETADHIPTVWITRELANSVLHYLKEEVNEPYRTLFDLTIIDERVRQDRTGQPPSDFTVVYHLLSYAGNTDIRLKVALRSDDTTLPTAVGIWPCAGWYEREAWDMFGVTFEGHPDLRRILLPPWWEGHALRKDHPARATEMGPFQLSDLSEESEQSALAIDPGEFSGRRDEGRHGVHVPELRARTIRAPTAYSACAWRWTARRSWTRSPISGITTGARRRWRSVRPGTPTSPTRTASTTWRACSTNSPTCLPWSSWPASRCRTGPRYPRHDGRALPHRSHLVWYGTFAQDLGALSPVFYTFSDRERVLTSSGDLRFPHAPHMVPHRGVAQTCRRDGKAREELSRLHAAAAQGV